MDASPPPWVEAHEAACRSGAHGYTDPETGYHVFTRLGHLARGRCCGAGCRHCPFDHEAVTADRRAKTIQQPAWLHRARQTAPETRDVLFWSGGKDSFLALRAWQREHERARVALLTTFDARTRVIAHQEVAIEQVVAQARALELDLVGVPLHAGAPYEQRVAAGLRVAAGSGTVQRLVFGDLHLQHIREWRDRTLDAFGAELCYPLWGVSWRDLLDDLETSGIPCTVSAVPEPIDGIAVGQAFDRALVERALSAGWDPFGENGEFHTLARVWEGTGS